MTGWVFAGSPDPMAGGLGDQGGGGLESETTTQRSKHKISGTQQTSQQNRRSRITEAINRMLFFLKADFFFFFRNW